MVLKTRQEHHWTLEELQTLKAEYDGRAETITRLVRDIGVPRGALERRVRILGLGKNIYDSQWTKEQDEKLEALINRYPLSYVAENLGRTQKAVKCRAYKLGISIGQHDGWYNMEEVCYLFGTNRSKVKYWMASGALKGETTPHEWRFEEKELRKFILQKCPELVGRNIDLYGVIELVAGEHLNRTADLVNTREIN